MPRKSKYRVAALSYIVENHPAQIADIAEAAGTTTNNAFQLVSRFIKEELVEKINHNSYSPTQKGIKKLFSYLNITLPYTIDSRGWLLINYVDTSVFPPLPSNKRVTFVSYPESLLSKNSAGTVIADSNRHVMDSFGQSTQLLIDLVPLHPSLAEMVESSLLKEGWYILVYGGGQPTIRYIENHGAKIYISSDMVDRSLVTDNESQNIRAVANIMAHSPPTSPEPA